MACRYGWNTYRQVSLGVLASILSADFGVTDVHYVQLSTPGVLATWKVYEKEHNLDLELVLRSTCIRSSESKFRQSNLHM